MDAEIEKFKILIVDDSDFSRTNISSMLESDRYQVIGEAESAKEAIDILKDRSAHIAIVDIVMPEVSGIELAEYLHENFSDLAIIMISSLGQESIIIDSISAGASDFIQKPFKKEELITSIDKVISRIREEQ